MTTSGELLVNGRSRELIIELVKMRKTKAKVNIDIKNKLPFQLRKSRKELKIIRKGENKCLIIIFYQKTHKFRAKKHTA